MRMRVFLFLVLCLSAMRPARAQISGELRGILTDPSGAVVPSARVKLTSTETGETRSATADGEGRYTFSLLKIGDYSITVEAPGFRKTVAAARVRSAEVTAVNLKLDVGQVTEEVVVTDAASPLDTQNAQVQESFESKRIEEIPVGRDPNQLAWTLPGITPSPGAFNTGSFIANGNRARGNNITIDNITATDISVGGTGSSNNAVLNYSSIKEVKVITNTFSAEFGRNSGSQVQYITKSGTNRFHGEAYEYLQNDFFNARDWFDSTGQPTVTKFNEFGGVFGGPLIRNKTHFFVAGEKLVLRGAGAARIAQVPTPSMLAKVTDPTSKKLLDQYKLPAATTDLGSYGNVQQNAGTNFDQHQYSIRLDHQISGRDSIYGRFGVARNQGTSSNNTFVGGTNLTNFGFISDNSVYSINLNETHIFSPGVVNEFRAGFGRTTPIFNIGSTVPLGPRIVIASGEVDRFGHYEQGPQGRVQNTFQYGDTLTWVKGAHNFKAGGDFFRYHSNGFFEIQTRGGYTFLNWDDFAAGRPYQYVQRFGPTTRGHRTWLSGVFVQDDYRVTRTLTVNLGFRWETYGRVTEVNGLSSNLDLGCRESLGLAGSGPLGCFTVGEPASPTSHYAQPRVGFAWNPGGGRTVIRAGYGLVADFNFLNAAGNQRALLPFVVNQNITGIDNFVNGNTWAALVAGTAPIQSESSALVGKIRNDLLNYGDVNPVIDPGLRNPQVHQWSFGIERALPGHMVIKAGYTGTKGNYLQRYRHLNLNAARPSPAVSLEDEAARVQQFVASYNAMTGASQRPSTRLDPRFNVVNYYDNSANSNYHAFELLLSRVFRNGYSFQAAYTVAKSIDDVSDALSTFPNDSTFIQDPNNFRNNRAVSGFDLPQRLVVTHVWELPWGSHVQNRLLRAVAAGWGMAGISSWRAGFPITFDAGARLGVANISTITTGGVVRPNAAGPIDFNPLPAGSPGAPLGLTADPVAGRRISEYARSIGLSQPLLGNMGTLGRGSHRGNGVANFDWNVYKNTRLAEGWNLQLRCEIYNVFNHHAFQDVIRVITNPAFGQYISLAQGPRAFQMAAVVRF